MPKKKRLKPIEIVIVLDRSGSMSSMKDDAIGGFNSFIEGQATADGECLVSLLLFDNEYEVVYEGVPAQDVEALSEQTFVPCGSTALRDAIVRGSALLSRRATEGKLGSLVILTDGHENASWTPPRPRTS